MAAAELDSKDWQASLFAVYLGWLEPDAMLETVQSKSNSLSPAQLGESFFYLGQWYLLQQHSDKAKAMFEATIANAFIYSVEYTHAKAELKRL